MHITWISQGGFVFDNGAGRVVVDPYLSDDLRKLGHFRMSQPAVPCAELNPDVVVFTHDHLDHYDPVTVGEIIELYPDCEYVGTSSAFAFHKRLGRDDSKFSVLDVGGSREICGMKFIAVKAYHSDPLTMGLLIEGNGKLVYMSSDTLYNARLGHGVLESASKRIDLALVCINGKLGNMSWLDAAKLVEELRPVATAPMHYGLFADNTENPEPFLREVEKFGVIGFLLHEGIPFEI